MSAHFVKLWTAAHTRKHLTKKKKASMTSNWLTHRGAPIRIISSPHFTHSGSDNSVEGKETDSALSARVRPVPNNFGDIVMMTKSHKPDFKKEESTAAPPSTITEHMLSLRSVFSIGGNDNKVECLRQAFISLSSTGVLFTRACFSNSFWFASSISQISLSAKKIKGRRLKSRQWAWSRNFSFVVILSLGSRMTATGLLSVSTGTLMSCR